jgi:superfamily II DNA or RNA helicase
MISSRTIRSALFNPEEYFVSLETHSYIPRFHEKDQPYLDANVKKLLDGKRINKAQRAVLTYIKEGKFSQLDSPPPDPARLFPLLVESGFPVYHHYYDYTSQPLAFDLQPKPLRVGLVYEPHTLSGDQGQIRHDFFLRLHIPGRNIGDYYYARPFQILHSSYVQERADGTVELHRLTPLLARVFTQLEPAYEILKNYQYKYKYFQARLSGHVLEHYDRLVDDASRLFHLMLPPPLFKPQRVSNKPEPCFAVDFDLDAQTLRVRPAVNYGVYQQDVAETVYTVSRWKGEEFRRRESETHPGTHIVTVENETIHYARIDQKMEIRLNRKMRPKAEELGFTKTLRCQKRGANSINAYLESSWPRLKTFAQEKGYPIIFTRDALPTERAVFRADFSADLNAEHDWLYFDVACYCGEERITLEKLLVYIERGNRYWRRNDGTLVEIANHEELERLVRLLQSFQAKENGRFEGKLRNVAELEYVMTSSKHYNALRAKSFSQFVQNVQDGKPVQPVKLPQDLDSVLRPYQKAGVEWVYFLRSFRFAGILADEMGLGKTLQTLAVLSMERMAGRPSIVVCPKTLLYNWEAEAHRFVPDMKVLVYDGTPAERKELAETIPDHDLIITSYGMVKRDRDLFLHSHMRFNHAVLDEAQFIKNHATKNAQVVKQLNADYRLVLTGTPIENSVSELWSMFDFLMPGFLGKYDHFLFRFQRPIMESSDRSTLEHLRMKVQPFMLRRTKQEVLKELPPKIEQASPCHLSKAQSILYQQILTQVRGTVFDAVKRKGFQSSQIHILAGLMKLRQVCNHPALLTKDKDFREYESAKLDMCMELVDEVVESQRKVLIFSQFTQMLDIVSATLKDRNIQHLYLSGKTRNRQSLVDSFNTDPALPVFLISLKAGGTGLNLASAETVIIFDPWWNPSVENQAIDRAHRIGQTKTLNVYRLLTIGTIEEKIQALKEKKQQLFDAVVGESGDLFKKLTWDDVRQLFSE